MSADRDLCGDAVRALVALLDIQPDSLPADLVAQRVALQRAAIDTVVGWERIALTERDHDAATRARRWAAAAERAWDLARHELDVALGTRRAGGLS